MKKYIPLIIVVFCAVVAFGQPRNSIGVNISDLYNHMNNSKSDPYFSMEFKEAENIKFLSTLSFLIES